ncbi:hypothetical protein D3C87_587670 [compost metagenome]
MIVELPKFNYRWRLQYQEYQFQDSCRDYIHHIMMFAEEGSVLQFEPRKVAEDFKAMVRLLHDNSIIGWVRTVDDAHPMFSFIEKSNAMRMKLIYDAN